MMTDGRTDRQAGRQAGRHDYSSSRFPQFYKRELKLGVIYVVTDGLTAVTDLEGNERQTCHLPNYYILLTRLMNKQSLHRNNPINSYTLGM